MKNQVILFIKISNSNERKEESMDKMLHSLHKLLPQNAKISLEFVSSHQFLKFYIVIDAAYKALVESQLYVRFRNIEIEEAEDYISINDPNIATAQVDFKHKSSSFKTYPHLEESFLQAFFAVLSKTDPKDKIVVQIALKKIGSKIYERGIKGMIYNLLGNNLEKFSHDLYMGKFRIAYQGETKQIANVKLDVILNLFKNLKGNNELIKKKFFVPKNIYQLLQNRSSENGDFWTAEELATLYHFPTHEHMSSNIVHTTSKKAPAPDILPREEQYDEMSLSLVGETNFHNEKIRFGILDEDRRRHIYVIGKTGVGKSRFLERLMVSDIKHNHGFCLLDPHGDLSQAVLAHIPQNRIKDVIYVDPANRDFPIAFNPLEYTKDYEKRQHIAFFFIAIFKKILAADWNDRMEHILRYIIFALLETPDSNILGISRILSDVSFRHRIILQLQDPVVKQFWANEFSSWNEQYSSQAIMPILNKVGQFISNPMIRNMIGQQKNVLDFEKFMNEGKIVIINVSKGKLGEDNAAILGSMFITKIQQAAISRANLNEDQRRDFYFYIDEFQNFATEAFQSILSESRKYRLNLTIAHQYIDQINPEIRASVFGNVASFFVFAVGGNDAAYLAREFNSTFTADDILGLEAREMYIKMSINGRTSQPFSAKTITTQAPTSNIIPDIISNTQRTYATNRITVQRAIEKWGEAKINNFDFQNNTGEEFPEPLL